MRRSEVAAEIGGLVGEPLIIEDAANGWPSLATVQCESGEIEIALFVAPVGLSHRGRDGVERRFQNPGASSAEERQRGWKGRPLSAPPGRTPLLVGLWDRDEHLDVQSPVLVLADAPKREGLTTRHSIFVRTSALLEAASTGWSSSVGSDGEAMVCFHPHLLPGVAEAEAARIDLPVREVAIAVSAAGVADSRALDPAQVAAAAERARRSISAIVRDQRFALDVKTAYAEECSLCGLDLGLVQAAHIYPASAPGSQDEVANGLCLCSNHHDAFDRHMIWVDPETWRVRIHPAVLSQAESNVAVQRFVASTADTLRLPSDKGAHPSRRMFERRYSHFGEAYGWV